MQNTQYKVHPAATLFPMMTDEEYQGLKNDIDENGQREDIVVWKNQIIDGRNRLRACEELQRNPSIAELDEEHDPWKYVISHNLHRRHLTTSQRSMIAESLANMKQGNGGPGRPKGSIDPSSIDDAAKQLNVSPKSVKRARKVKDKGTPELAAMVLDGKVSVDAASKVATKPKTEQEAIVAQGPQAVKEAAKTVPKHVPPGGGVNRDEPTHYLKDFKLFWKQCDETGKKAIYVWLQDNFKG